MFLLSLCKGESQVPNTQLSGTNQKWTWETCDEQPCQWKETNACSRSHLTSYTLPFPVPSALPPGTGIWIANISYLFLSHNVYFLPSKNTPATLLSSCKDRKWRVPAMSLSPFQGHKWRWKPCHCSLLTGRVEKGIQHTKEPSWICHGGLFQKSGNKTNIPLKEGATLRTWPRRKQSHQSLTQYMVGNHRKDLLSLKPPNWA